MFQNDNIFSQWFLVMSIMNPLSLSIHNSRLLRLLWCLVDRPYWCARREKYLFFVRTSLLKTSARQTGKLLLNIRSTIIIMSEEKRMKMASSLEQLKTLTTVVCDTGDFEGKLIFQQHY